MYIVVATAGIVFVFAVFFIDAQLSQIYGGPGPPPPLSKNYEEFCVELTPAQAQRIAEAVDAGEGYGRAWVAQRNAKPTQIWVTVTELKAVRLAEKQIDRYAVYVGVVEVEEWWMPPPPYARSLSTNLLVEGPLDAPTHIGEDEYGGQTNLDPVPRPSEFDLYNPAEYGPEAPWHCPDEYAYRFTE